MSQWGQPSRAVHLEGRRCRLQILDPETAFELEHGIIERLGEALCYSVTQPATLAHAFEAAIEGDGAVPAAVATLRRVGDLARQLLTIPNLDGAWLVGVAERFLFDRLEVEGLAVGSWREWSDLRFPPGVKWQALGVQLSQTYAPLWSRSPYNAGSRKVNDYGVPVPSASRTVQWAAALARRGYVSSVDEVLRTWTPARMIDLVEIAAEATEREWRASDAAREGSG